MARIGVLLAILLLPVSTTLASDNEYLLNFDLITKLSDGSIDGRIQLQGIRVLATKAFHGDDFGKYDYFLTVSNVKDGKGKLTVEFYEYETRKKKSDVVSEIVSEVDFWLGSPTVFEATSDTFGVDLAFSIVNK